MDIHVNSFSRTRKFVFVMSINITVLWILLIFETIGKQHLSQILEQTLDIILKALDSKLRV